MESTFIFASVISEEEWSSVDSTIAKRLERFVQDKFDELITGKALLETNRSNADKALSELKIQYESLVQENNELRSKLESAEATISEYETNYTTLKNDLVKLQATCNRLESENAEFRHQRNMAIDERDEHLKMLQRRTNEVERLQSDLETITKQLESAINAKCEALAKSDEVESMKLRLEYREKRIDQERQLLNSQIESLTEDLNKKTEELLNMRRDNTSRCIQLETKLTEKTQELIVANEKIKSWTELNNNLTLKNEELLQKLLDQREADSKMNESYLHEIEAKTKLSNAYKSMFEESQQHAEGLKEALAEVQQLLKKATEQYGDLETKHKETELANEEILAKKNECIAMLKKELEVAKEMMEQCKNEQFQKDIEGLSPTAAPAAGLFKSGTTATELYYQYTNANLRVADLEKENSQLKNYINTIIHEIEEKGPLIRKLREDYTNAIDANELLKNNNDELTNEIQQLREANAEAIRLEESISRENARYKKEITDLSRQVCHLLQEIEHARIGGGGSSSTSTDMDTNDSLCSADIITKKLVTFNDIVELQNNNQKLLAVVRELTERQEEMEAFDPSVLADMKMKLENLKESHQELLNERERQNKMMSTLSNQRDMYKNLYTQAIKAAGEELPPNQDISSDKTQNDVSGDSTSTTNTTITTNEKIQDLLNINEDYKKKIEQLKNDNEVYRKEKTANEKILLEQMETLRAENKDLIKQNCRLSSQLENSEEKFKISQNNLEIYKKQITALEKQNKIYNDTIIKHEEAVTYLKEETMQSQTKLSRAEVILGNLQKENALLKDAETRLVRERDNLKRELHTQNMIQTNIELIKATLERTDAESKLRLEARLDEAHRECSALRRRLQEEQDRFRQLTEHLEQQTQNAKQRMEEEKQEAEKLRNDLTTTRSELIEKTNQIDELTRKIKTSIILSDTQQSQHDHVHRIVQLEQQLNDCKAEIELLNTKLKTAKEASDQYYNVATNSENQLKLLMEQQEQYKKEIEQQKDVIKQLQEKCSELEGELSIQMDDQDINNSGKSKSHQLQEELNIATMDLQTAKEQLENALSENKSLIDNLKAVENKYAREVMLHSADLQLLTDMKSELEQVRSELNDIKQARDCAINELQECKISWENQEKILQKEKQELEERFKHMDEQNNLLLDQIQALNTQLSLLQAQQTSSMTTTTSGEQSNISIDTSFNKSFTEDDIKSSEQLLTIIKYLRQEKDIAVNKCEIMDAEYQRLKSQSEILTKQLNEAKAIIENERQKSEVSMVSTAKHAEVLRKVETLNAITDSNRALRQERDELKKQIDEMKQLITKLENELQPLQERNRELTIKAEAMQTENISLRGECTRWRQRAQMLIEKSNRTSPEDWKKLQNERETLAKQITIERSNIVKLNDEINNLKQEKVKTDDQLKNFKQQTAQQLDELTRQRDDLTNLQQQVQQLTQQLEQTQETNKRILEENRILTEDTAGKDVNITELKNNLTQIRKIAKKYKIQCEDQIKEIKTLKEENEIKESEQNLTNERQMQEQRNELQERIIQLEQTSKESLEKLNQEIQRLNEENENYKKEVETLRQGALEREERFKNLFKNAKDRIVQLTEQNNTLKAQIDNCEKSDNNDNDGSSDAAGTSGTDTIVNNADKTELMIKIDALENEKAAILAEKRQDNEKYESEIESLMQKVTQLQRQLGQQSSRPTTSSTTTDKTPTEPPPTANIKPMATNTQTQSVSIQPWRSAGETPLASIRPMSAQSRTTVAVLPTSQTPSSAAVMILPQQQQVHTTGSGSGSGTSSSNTEILSNSPTSSHTTEYVPATSSATAGVTATTGGGTPTSVSGETNSSSGPRQVVVPPTQSTQDTEEDDDVNMQTTTQPQSQQQQQSTTQQQQPSQPQQQSQQQQTQPQQQQQQQQQASQQPQQQQLPPPPQQQAVALVLPRIETPGSGGSTEQSTSSSNSSNTVTTTQATSLKRQRESDTDQNDEQSSSSTTGMNLKIQQQSKKSRLQQSSSTSGTTVSDSGLEVEYQVPTSSQRDHDDDNVIVLESDDEGGPDEGEGADDEPDDADTEGYDMETMEQDNYEDADCQDVEDDEEGGNEVEVIEDSSEVPNQSERSTQQGNSQEESVEPTQPEATSSGSDGGGGGAGQQSGVTLSQASTSVSMTMPSFSRTRSVAPLPSNRQQQQQQQQHSHLLLSHGLEEGGDDGIVPSTPTLFVPRRSDGFGEAVSSPHVPTSGRFTFNESMPQNTAGSSGEVVPEQTIETANIDENSTGRSVPSTPLQASPQESMPGPDEQGASQTTQSDAELPTITVSGVSDEPTAEGSSEECMGPPNVAAGTSTDGNQSTDQLEESEGYDGVSSEGEKAPNTDDGEEEGREAEASPSTNTRSRASRGQSVARRSVRQVATRGSITRSGPTPIVWVGGDQRNHRHQAETGGPARGGRGNVQMNYSPRSARRARGRPQRPYGRY